MFSVYEWINLRYIINISVLLLLLKGLNNDIYLNTTNLIIIKTQNASTGES